MFCSEQREYISSSIAVRMLQVTQCCTVAAVDGRWHLHHHRCNNVSDKQHQGSLATAAYAHRLLFAEEHLCEVHPGKHQSSDAKYHQENCQANRPIRHLLWRQVKPCIMLQVLCTATWKNHVRSLQILGTGVQDANWGGGGM
jgi:hypothetical protein